MQQTLSVDGKYQPSKKHNYCSGFFLFLLLIVIKWSSYVLILLLIEDIKR